MPRPNRTDRRLHWRIEIFKVSTGTLVLLLGGLVALWGRLSEASARWQTWEGVAMVLGIVMSTLLLAFVAVLGWIVIMSIRTLPDE